MHRGVKLTMAMGVVGGSCRRFFPFVDGKTQSALNHGTFYFVIKRIKKREATLDLRIVNIN